MKKSLSIIIFIVIAVGVILAGMWYSAKISEESQSSIVDQGNAAAQAQAQLMQNLKITDVTVGTGATAQTGDTVTVNYLGTFDNGVKFDSSYDRNQPFTFTLGHGDVIQGWDLGVVGMKVGGKRQLVVPPELGYGSRQYGPIPPNSTLHFTIELLSVSTSSAVGSRP